MRLDRLRTDSVGRALRFVPWVLLLLVGCDPNPGPSVEQFRAGKELFEKVCSRCHSLDIPLRRRKSRDEWRDTIRRMRARGAPLSDGEAEKVAWYLSQFRGR